MKQAAAHSRRQMKQKPAQQHVEKDQLKDEVAAEYKQQLDLQRETMLKWKEKITELSAEMTSIEEERVRADKEHKETIARLRQAKQRLEADSAAKQAVLAQTQGEVALTAMQGALSKVKGDAVSKIKFGKASRKRVFFVGGAHKHLFYYDESSSNKQEHKFMVVSDVSVRNNAIEKQMKLPWFLVLGRKRCALFAADDEATRDAWVAFIKQALGKEPVDNVSGGFTPAASASSPSSGDDEKGKDE